MHLRFAMSLVASLMSVGCGRSELHEPFDSSNAPTSASLAPTCTEAIDAGAPLLGVINPFAQGCIEVRYTAEEEGELPQLRTALARWAAPHCTSLCFREPALFDGIPNPPHQILLHLDHGALRPSDGVIGVYFTDVVGNSRLRASVTIIRRPGTTANDADYLSAVGQALGFEQKPGVVSVLSEPRTELTPADYQSVCSLYPCRTP